jgi:hypothetical protein
MDEMTSVIGYPPELGAYSPVAAKPVALKPVELPKEATKIHWDDREVYALATRGVTWEHIQQFDIRSDGKRLYVPVYEGGELVQYNSRRVDRAAIEYEDWFDAGPKPYKYASGHPITHYFLGWDECKLWDNLVLVENTFVSMWLRHLDCTATFGSHLSDTQIDKISHSNIKKVTFLWDSGTQYASEKAVKKLRALGIECKVVTLKGQPDDHTLAEIEEMI